MLTTGMARRAPRTLTILHDLIDRADGEDLPPRLSPRAAVDVLALPFRPTFHLKGRAAPTRHTYRRIAESAGYVAVTSPVAAHAALYAKRGAQNRGPLPEPDLGRVFSAFTPVPRRAAPGGRHGGVATTFANTHADLQGATPHGRRYECDHRRACIKQTWRPPTDSSLSEQRDFLHALNPQGER